VKKERGVLKKTMGEKKGREVEIEKKRRRKKRSLNARLSW